MVRYLAPPLVLLTLCGCHSLTARLFEPLTSRLDATNQKLDMVNAQLASVNEGIGGDQPAAWVRPGQHRRHVPGPVGDPRRPGSDERDDRERRSAARHDERDDRQRRGRLATTNKAMAASTAELATTNDERPPSPRSLETTNESLGDVNDKLGTTNETISSVDTRLAETNRGSNHLSGVVQAVGQRGQLIVETLGRVPGLTPRARRPVEASRTSERGRSGVDQAIRYRLSTAYCRIRVRNS